MVTTSQKNKLTSKSSQFKEDIRPVSYQIWSPPTYKSLTIARKILSLNIIIALLMGWIGCEFEKEFRVQEKDPRIHFTVNCGAKGCPPVHIYNPATLEEDFDRVASAYLKRVSTYDKTKQVVKTTPLFNWFTGDWGGKDGVRDMLYKYGILPKEHKDIDLEWIDYDWTLDINNFG